MSSSWSCEQELKKLAEQLHQQAYELENAAATLETLRNSNDQQKKIEAAKEWAKDWMRR